MRARPQNAHLTLWDFGQVETSVPGTGAKRTLVSKFTLAGQLRPTSVTVPGGKSFLLRNRCGVAALWVRLNLEVGLGVGEDGI